MHFAPYRLRQLIEFGGVEDGEEEENDDDTDGEASAYDRLVLCLPEERELDRLAVKIQRDQLIHEVSSPLLHICL